MSTALGVAMVIYLGVLFGLGLWSKDKVHSTEDFLVAGRRLPLSLAWATLFATWFGAGTLLAAADEVAASGLRVTAMEPLGAGLCLVVAGLFFARPLWEARLLTLADFYRNRFGRRAELFFSVSVITYFAWIAAQLVGMAGILSVFFDFSLLGGVLTVAVIAAVYTLIGGMWSVTVTDALQVGLLISGLLLVTWTVLSGFGDGPVEGLSSLFGQIPDGHRVVVPRESFGELMNWVNLLAIGTLGNLAGSDLMQRVFAAKTPRIAQKACILAGVLYILVGTMPAILGLAAGVLLHTDDLTAVLPQLAELSLSPALAVIFLLALTSAVLSTIDSAMLTAASVMANNIIRPWVPERIHTLKLTRICVVVVTGLSIGLALAGESAFSLLESSYSMTLAGAFVPLTLGLFWSRGGEWAALSSFVVGYGLWVVEAALSAAGSTVLEDTGLPIPLVAMTLSFIVYVLVALASPPPEPASDS